MQQTLFDDHMHSSFSIDGCEPVPALCRAAVGAGLQGLAITDHFDTEPSDAGYGRYDFDRLQRAVDGAGAAYGERLSLLVGAEVCYQPPFARRIAAFMRSCPLDFVLGSVHYVRHELVSEAWFATRPARAAYEAYFDAVEEAAGSGLFDAIGHLDVARRYGLAVHGPFDPGPYWERIERILKLLIATGTALEINSSGWRRGAEGPFPGEAILRRYGELGGTRITVGSDAHSAVQVGHDIARALDLARSIGFTHLTRYVQRRPQEYPL